MRWKCIGIKSRHAFQEHNRAALLPSIKRSGQKLISYSFSPILWTRSISPSQCFLSLLHYNQMPILNLPPQQEKVSKHPFQNRVRFVTKTHNCNRGKKPEALAHSNNYFPFLLKQHNEAITVLWASKGFCSQSNWLGGSEGAGAVAQGKETTPTRYDSLTTKTSPWYLLLFMGWGQVFHQRGFSD